MTSSDEQRRLAPDMASFRLLVLAFVREYLEKWCYSPSQGEIANGLHVTRDKVRDALDSLVDEGLLLRSPGPRGLSLPSLRDQALRLLRQQGWTIDEDIQAARAAPESPLPGRILFDYPEDGSDFEGEQDGQQAA